MEDPILLTGTIAPGNISFLNKSDTNLRLKDYLTSIIFWIIYSPFTRFIFCENSNYKYDFSFLKAFALLYEKELEVIHFDGLNDSKQYGKGYGESKILNYALEHSTLLKTSKHFYKITGRLFIENIAEIVSSHEQDNIVFMRDKNNNSVDTRFFKMEKIFYADTLSSAFEETNDFEGRAMESVYHDRLAMHPEKVTALKKLPIVQGTSGSTGDVYDKPSAWKKWRREFSIKRGKYNFPLK
jgi:hypothetical protein